MRSQSYHRQSPKKKKKEERRREAEGTSAREMMGSEAPLVLVKSARAKMKIFSTLYSNLPFSTEKVVVVSESKGREREREREKRAERCRLERRREVRKGGEGREI
jgi:hypothetical protein